MNSKKNSNMQRGVDHGVKLWLVRFACLVLLAMVHAVYAAQDPCCSVSPQSAVVTEVVQKDAMLTSVQMSNNFAPGRTDIALEQTGAKFQKTFWPWWLGALALGSLTLVFWSVLRIPLGVSNSCDKVLSWRHERASELLKDDIANADQDQLHAALRAETLAQFGPKAIEQATIRSTANVEKQNGNPRLSVASHLIFLVMIGVGGVISALLSRGIEMSFDLGPEHREYFSDGPALWVVLLLGGAITGFGARAAGGCNTGHGLSGMACLQVGSIITTASFFGTAIFVSILIEWLL